MFGPVLAIQPHDEVADVVDAADDSDYGLAAGIWTRSLSEAHRLSRGIGAVWINCHLMYEATLSIGGGKRSGQVAMETYLEWKTVRAVL